MSQTVTVILRTRISPERKAQAEEVLERLGITPTQVINMLFAQIVERKEIPFKIGLPNDGDVAVPIEQVARTWNSLDDTDYSYLLQE